MTIRIRIISIAWLFLAPLFLRSCLSEPNEIFAAEPVNLESSVFPDPIFLQYLKRFDRNHDGVLSDLEIENIRTVNVSAMGISSLEGI